jgi:predicted DCC family thiol-disulfide oxidoreductase YuxK
MTQSETRSTGDHPIVLYDGVCGLCNRSVQFIMKRDRERIFRFASLQSALAARILARHGANPSDLDTMYVVLNCDVVGGEAKDKELLLSRSDAALFILRELGGAWLVVAKAIQLLPRAARDRGYRAIASSRYRMFGRYETCPLPDEATRARFVDV